MLKITTIYLDADHMKRLARLGTAKGLKPSQLVRLAIAEYLERVAKRSSSRG